MTLHNPFLDPFDDEPHHTSSPTAHLLDELQMYGYRPHGAEPDPRPLPEAARAEQQIENGFASLPAQMAATRLEDALNDMPWHRVTTRTEESRGGKGCGNKSRSWRMAVDLEKK